MQCLERLPRELAYHRPLYAGHQIGAGLFARASFKFLCAPQRSHAQVGKRKIQRCRIYSRLGHPITVSVTEIRQPGERRAAWQVHAQLFGQCVKDVACGAIKRVAQCSVVTGGIHPYQGRQLVCDYQSNQRTGKTGRVGQGCEQVGLQGIDDQYRYAGSDGCERIAQPGASDTNGGGACNGRAARLQWITQIIQTCDQALVKHAGAAIRLALDQRIVEFPPLMGNPQCPRVCLLRHGVISVERTTSSGPGMLWTGLYQAVTFLKSVRGT